MWKWIIAVIMTFVLAYTIASFVVRALTHRHSSQPANTFLQTTFFFCERLDMLWDPKQIPTAFQCWSPSVLQALTLTHASLNIVTDLIFAVGIPIPMLWKLQLNERAKAAILVILSLGVFVCVAAILKIPEIKNFGEPRR